MSDQSGGLGKWLAGILAAVISGVIIYQLTGSKTPPPQPPIVISSVKADPIPASKPKPIQFTIMDNLNLALAQVSEDVKVYIEGKLVANLMVDQYNTTATANVTVPSSGNYSYSILADAYFMNQYGQAYPARAVGEGAIEVREGSSFELVITPYGAKLAPR